MAGGRGHRKVRGGDTGWLVGGDTGCLVVGDTGRLGAGTQAGWWVETPDGWWVETPEGWWAGTQDPGEGTSFSFRTVESLCFLLSPGSPILGSAPLTERHLSACQI